MVKYVCEVCDKSFSQKCHYVVHVNRLKGCKDKNDMNIDNEGINLIKQDNVKLNNDDDSIIEAYKDNDYSDTKLPNKDDKSVSMSISEDNYITEDGYVGTTEKDVKNNKNDKLLCKNCASQFSTSGSLKRHLNGRCKMIKETVSETTEKKVLTTKISTLQEQIDALTKIIVGIKDDKVNLTNTGTLDISTNVKNEVKNKVKNEVKNEVKNQVNGNITNNTNNNIKIEFGKEDLDKITNDFFIKTLVNNSGASIPSKIIEGIHFNPELKEFMNVFIADLSRNKAMIFDGKTWNIANADEIVDTLFYRAIVFCENRNEELHDKIQKNDKINKKINKEMYVMHIMSNNEPYDYDEKNRPVDMDGNVLSVSELVRGKSLNAKAKEHLKNNLYNKKMLIVK
jgi:hypothetical protein